MEFTSGCLSPLAYRGRVPDSVHRYKFPGTPSYAGAYRLREGAEPAGLRILLVDDVVTSGATLSECARLLRSAGAAEVLCATLAQARKS